MDRELDQLINEHGMTAAQCEDTLAAMALSAARMCADQPELLEQFLTMTRDFAAVLKAGLLQGKGVN